MLKAIVGAVLLVAAFVLSYASYTKGEAMMAKKEALVMKYVKASDDALAKSDIKGAIKYAKMAIEADPKDKKGYVCYNNALVAKYKPVKAESSGEEAPKKEAPAPSEEDDSLLGC